MDVPKFNLMPMNLTHKAIYQHALKFQFLSWARLHTSALILELVSDHTNAIKDTMRKLVGHLFISNGAIYQSKEALQGFSEKWHPIWSRVFLEACSNSGLRMRYYDLSP